ncbi:MAG: outer membrane beta-barrel protein [Pseudomonadota bacterium]
MICNTLRSYRFDGLLLAAMAISCLCLVPGTAHGLVTEFVPMLSVDGQYTDNYFGTKADKKDEFSTVYSVNLSLGFSTKTAQCLIVYEPSYVDYRKYSENDSVEHHLTIDGNVGLSRTTSLSLSEGYSNAMARAVVDGGWIKTQSNQSQVSLVHQFGVDDEISLDYTYGLTNYDKSDINDSQSHSPGVSMKYWFTPQTGIETGLSFTRTDFTKNENDQDSVEGNIRINRKLNKQWNLYADYSQTNTIQKDNDSKTLYPSIGVDWQTSQTSHIAVGFGYLMQEWQDKESQNKLFAEFDAFKDWQFSKRGSVYFTGSSKYEPLSQDAASLGFKISYQAGVLVNYQLAKTLASSLMGSFQRSDYQDPDVKRTDDVFGAGAGFVWSPFKWMDVEALYSFIDFSTDSKDREDYTENRVDVRIVVKPELPMTIIPGSQRKTIERRIYND